ncbi:hypothetical protein ACWEQL_25540 [Kitasatospora sp. NPDC004240]
MTDDGAPATAASPARSGSAGELTVALDGHLAPVTLPVEAAIARLWQTARGLAIRPEHAAVLRNLLTHGSGSIEFHLSQTGRLELEAELVTGSTVLVRAWRGEWQTRAQHVAVRYVPEAAPNTDPNSKLERVWVMRDQETGGLVTQGAGVMLHGSEESARKWLGRQVTLAGYAGYKLPETTGAER